MSELSSSWEWAKLGTVAEILMGQSQPGDSYNQIGIGTPLINGPVEFGSSAFSNTVKSKFTTSPTKMCIKGDLILCVRGSTTGRMNIAGFKACIGRGVAAIRSSIYQQYLNFFIYANREQIYGLGTGSTFPNVSSDMLSEIITPIPPLNEQRRIVAKLEKLLAKCDTCKQRLDKIPDILKRFRQAILAAACSGRLNADWHEQNPDIEPAIILLEKTEKIRLKEALTPTQQQRINEIYSYQEERDSGLLPDNWMYIALDKLCDSFQYGTSTKSAELGKVPVLRMGNIQNGEIDWSDLVYTSDEGEIEKYALRQGNVLFNRTNSPELVGKTSIYRGEPNAIFAGYLIRINSRAVLNSEYLNYCLNTPYAKEYCLKVKSDGVSQSNINAQKLGKFEVPFCSVEEQKEIVQRVEKLFKLADQIEQRYQKARAYVDKLPQSILAKAFRGELMPQDPKDEPAAVLLERIRAERNKEGKGERVKGKGGRSKGKRA